MKDVLRVFDVDNTLLIPCNIYIYKRCKITREILVKLSPKEYSVDVLHVSQYYDFTEFDDKTRCKDSIINGKILYNDFTNGEKIAVLTARICPEAVYESLLMFFAKHNVDVILDISHVFCVGNSELKTPEAKLRVLLKLQEHYSIVFYDDDFKNVDLAKSNGIDSVLVT